MKMNCLWKGPAALGEGPLWHAKEKALYWVDITNKGLYRWDSTTEETHYWEMPGWIGCIAIREKGGFIAGINDEICFIELPSGKVKKQVTVPDHYRLNDGKCDRQGRFWIGTAPAKNPDGHLYRFDPDGKLYEMQEGISISNGLGWSPDDAFFYHTDSTTRIIYRYRFNSKTGEISDKKTWIETPHSEDVPDGLTIDSQGDIWSARWNGWKIIHYSKEGKMIEEISMPMQRPTSCIFGGEDLATLFITSCSRDLNENHPLPSPSGAVYSLSLNRKGLPEPEFQG